MAKWIACLLLLLSPFSQAARFTIGEQPPALVINSRGELVMRGDEFAYEPWTLPEQSGRVHVLQYMAGRMSARGQTKPFTDTLESALPDKSFHITTVINLDDALWGTTGFVVSEVKSNKRKYPNATMVLDEQGTGLSAWDLQPGGATTVILDPGGSVMYFKEGAMSAEEIDRAIELMRSYISP